MHGSLDANLKKSDLNNFMIKQRQHLSTNKRKVLLALLRDFEDKFNDMVGTWNTTLL